MTGRDPLGAAVAWLAHPISLLGLGLLLLNDHVFKQAWPGVLTGKLSDLAGMLMFPPLLAALTALALPRARAKTLAVVALCLTGCGFAVLKFWGYPAELASAALTVVSGPSVVRADRTDLLVLPALALAWLAFRRARRRPVASGDARLIRVVVLLPLALFGSAATSCGADNRPPPVVGKSPDGSVWLRSQVRDGDVEYMSTVDGGLTFRRNGPSRTPTVREQDCAAGTCYRVMRGKMLVQQRVGTGPWTTAWELDPGQRRDLIAASATCDDPDGRRFESQALVVIPQSGGHVVLVSNGDDGLLRRNVSGTWTRIGWGAGTSPPALSQGVLPGGNLFFSVAIVVLILLFGGLGVAALKARAPWRVRRWALLFVLAAGDAIGLDAQVIAWGDTAHPAFVAGSAALSVAALVPAVLFVVLARRFLPVAWTTVMVMLVAGVAWLSEALRHESLMFGEGISFAAVVVTGFIAVAITGLGARLHPRQIG
ncbi:MAG TPA: hypothetical protein VFC19_44330 [Candidatus Limnocylindrales bacterium]|nr:hypothetical protein [Candidatus Limnocylindrales bacterium]